MENKRIAGLLQIGGGIVLGLAATLVVLRIITGQQAGEGMLAMLGPAALLLMLGIGLGLTMLGLAALLNRRPAPQRVAPAIEAEHSEMRELLLELRDEFNLLRSNIATEMARREVDEETLEPQPGESAHPFTIAPPPPADTSSTQKILQVLEEVREISLMNEAQRQELLQRRRQHRKIDRLKRAQGEIAVGHWAEAQRLLDLVKVDFPDDADLRQVQDELRIARSNAEHEAVDRTRSRIEDLMALGSWDEALEIVQRLAADYPDSTDARQLLERVTNERNLFRDNTAERIYREIKGHIEHRQWRRARAEAERLLDMFPDHRRAARIREQITLLRENADVEERQEQELRIQELIKARRLSEAIELAEELIERYPDSPQAQGLTELLPRLRERAIREEIGA